MTTASVCRAFRASTATGSSNAPSCAPAANTPEGQEEDPHDVDESILPCSDEDEDYNDDLPPHPRVPVDDCSSRGDEDPEEDDGLWSVDGFASTDNDEEVAAARRKLPPWMPLITKCRNSSRSHRKMPVISSSSDDEDSSSDESSCSSSSEESLPHAHREPAVCANDIGSLCRFSLPKHLYKSSHPAAQTQHQQQQQQSTHSSVDLSVAISSPSHGEVTIRADLLQRHQLHEILALMHTYAPVQRLVVKDVHRGPVVEALLKDILFPPRSRETAKTATTSRAEEEDSSDYLRSLTWTGSWISPSLIQYLASPEATLEELALGLTLYPKGRSPRRPPLRRLPRGRSLSRQLERLQELEEALAVNSSLRVLCLLPSCHTPMAEGLVWAASCHSGLEQVEVSLPIALAESETNLLFFEGVAELLKLSVSLRQVELRVDASLSRLRRNLSSSSANNWRTLAAALQGTTTLQHLSLVWGDQAEDIPDNLMDEMSSSLLAGISNNRSLQSLEVARVPAACALDLWYSIHMREVPLEHVTLRESPDMLTALGCLEQEKNRESGWWKLQGLAMDQATTAVEDLQGLAILTSAGNLRDFGLLDGASKAKADRIMKVLTTTAGSQITSLTVSHDHPSLLRTLHGTGIRELEVDGGRYPVTPGGLLELLSTCPQLGQIRLKEVEVDGDLSSVWSLLERHGLDSLEVIEEV